MSKAMKINICLILLSSLYCASLWNDRLSFPEDKKEVLDCGEVVDAKQVPTESGNINNYLYQRLNGKVKKVNVTDDCYYNWRNKIGKSICFSRKTEDWSCIATSTIMLSGVLCIWIFISFLIHKDVFE
jgi:hypothetical protein